MALRSEWDEKLGTMRPFVTTGDYDYLLILERIQGSSFRGNESPPLPYSIVLCVESVIGEYRGVSEAHQEKMMTFLQRSGCYRR